MSRIIVAGGGTGGHISPAIAVSESMGRLAPDVSVEFIGSVRPVDRRMYAGFGSAFHPLDPPRMDRGALDLLMLPFRVVPAYMEARRLIRRIEPAALLSTGGYTSFFPCLAASRMGIPVLLHESNSIPGKANRMASRFAGTILTGFRSAAGGFSRPVIYTGNPVRASLRRVPSEEARSVLGIPAHRTCVLFLGGSQGARALNDMALEVPEGFHVILQSGTRDEDRVRGLAGGSSRVTVVGFVDDPSPLYSAADMAVARAGSMTIAELAWFRLPSLLVPYPFSADGHQSINAGEIASSGGALLMEETELDAEIIWSVLSDLATDRQGRENMAEAMEGIMPGNPADLIAEIVLDRAGIPICRSGERE